MSSEPLGTDKHEVPKGMNELDSTMPPGHLQGDLTRDLPVRWVAGAFQIPKLSSRSEKPGGKLSRLYSAF